ncbi:putative quinol monooxygenase [Pseudonocardia sp. GCM10023141]|uniref:putative quinol monooxygenase n=1 Tax=Pseudonocardia sp. GCM10023141 TaxID=3252653 RepID=UPI00360D95EB
MPTLGFLVTFEAQPGKEDDVAAFLTEPLAMVEAEPGTFTWNSFRSGPTTFGIFDTFDTEDDRHFHLNGEVRKAIEARAADLFAVAPTISPVDIIATKLPA